MSQNVQLCYVLAIAAAIGFAIWGFMDALKPKQHHERSEVSVISRQLRGFTFLIISQLVMVIGMAICYGMGGGKLPKIGTLKLY